MFPRPRRSLDRLALARVAALAVAALAAVGAAGCHGRSAADAPAARPAAREAPVVVLQASGGRDYPVRVELARTPEEQARGLMYRNRLDPDAGMLFLYDRPGPLTFWMKNTYIPLDMIFIGADRRIVGIVEEAVPGSLDARRVAGNSQYVLEIGGGLSRRLGIAAGSRVEIRGVTLP